VPPPKVDSAFVGMRLQAPPLPENDMPAFESFLRAAFSQRRKTLLNSFTSSFSRPAVENALTTRGRNLKTRAEALDLADLLELFRALTGRGGGGGAAPGGILSATESTGNPRKP
jgi:16S rRNA (adenine1518-N6/adenine1519-N6)-dimethyltransferase